MVVSPDLRRFLAFLSACGLTASVVAYIESFSGTMVDETMRLVFLLPLGALALEIPIHTLEHPSSRNRRFYWKEFARRMPSWVMPFSYLLVAVVIAHGILFFLQGGTGMPTVENGQYFINGHGRVLKVLTQTEYVGLRKAELRMLASLMIACYFVPTMYWWFCRNPQKEEGGS